MIKWIRPSGTEIETNDSKATIDYCVSLGWKPAESEKKPAKKKVTKKRGTKSGKTSGNSATKK